MNFFSPDSTLPSFSTSQCLLMTKKSLLGSDRGALGYQIKTMFGIASDRKDTQKKVKGRVRFFIESGLLHLAKNSRRVDKFCGGVERSMFPLILTL